MKISYIFYLVSFLFALSCEAQNKQSIEIDIRDCVNIVINDRIKKIYGANPIDFYDTMKDVEYQLLKFKLINDISKESYLELFSKIQSENKETYTDFYIKTKELLNDRRLDFTNFALIDAIFSICPYEVLIKIKNYESTEYYNYAVILNEMTKGLNNQEAIKNLMNFINENDFKQLDYRASIILLIIINMDYKFNPVVQIE